MRTQQSGTIVNDSRIAGLKSGSGRSACTATEYSVVALSKSAALEEGAQGIRVNAVPRGDHHADGGVDSRRRRARR